MKEYAVAKECIFIQLHKFNIEVWTKCHRFLLKMTIVMGYR